MTAQRRLSRCKDQNNADEPTSNGPSGFPANGLSGALEFAAEKEIVVRRHALCNEKAVGRLTLWTVPYRSAMVIWAAAPLWRRGRSLTVIKNTKKVGFVYVCFWVDLLDKCGQFQIMRETIACLWLCFFLWGTFLNRSQSIASRCGRF